jgi:apolipoprotein N-acyltransferase
MPWLSLGYAFIDSTANAWAPVIGVYGLGALVVATSGAIWLVFSGSRRERMLCLLAMVILSATSLRLPAPGSWTKDSDAGIEVSLVQGNIPQELKWKPGRRELTQAHYLDLTDGEWGRRLIIWPEVAIPTLRNRVEDYLIEVQQTAVMHGSTLLLGILVRDGDEAPLYNSLLALGADTGAYYKRHLVPFGEYFPVPGFLLDVGSLLGLQYSDFSAGPEVQEPLRVGEHVLGVSICFEDVFGDEIRRALPEAGILVNVTNDAWFADSLAPHQHLQIARMRALETGRSLLRVANTGISAVIGPDGVISTQSSQFAVDVRRARVAPREGMTPYARWGDLPVWCVVLLVLTGFAVLHWRASSAPKSLGDA